MDMGPGPGPRPKKGAVPFAAGASFLGPGPGPGPISIMAAHMASQSNKQEGINSYSAQNGINSKGNLIDI